MAGNYFRKLATILFILTAMGKDTLRFNGCMWAGVYTFKTFRDKNIKIIIKVCFIVIRFYKSFNCMPAAIEPFKVSTL